MTQTPQVIEMEKFVLSSMLLKDGEIIPAVTNILSADDFYRPEHRVTFNAILALAAKGINPNLLSLSEELRANGKINDVGIEFVLALGNIAFTTKYTEIYCKTIKEKARLRKLIAYGEKLSADAQDVSKDTDKILADAATFFNDFFSDGLAAKSSQLSLFYGLQFQPFLKEMSHYSDRSCGFDNIDEKQAFIPGVYVIGAAPAIGKTTFTLQMAYELAADKNPVIYCSYEMSTGALAAKNLARQLRRNYSLFDLDLDRYPTAADFITGRVNLEKNMTIYQEYVNQIQDTDGFFEIIEPRRKGIDYLLALLRPKIAAAKKPPVIFVDYLQHLIPPTDNIRVAVDDAMHKIKQLQEDENCTFVVISSTNRLNYRTPISMEALKESGGIEFAADFIWGLQLAALHPGKELSIAAIEEARRQYPRLIELKCLKNRWNPNFDVLFNYYAASDYFQPVSNFDADRIFGNLPGLSANDQPDD